MQYPLISIVIATSNSEKTLPKTLSSIKKQNYPHSRIEVLIIDGMSHDKTREIARDFGFEIIDNPKIGFIPAKHLGFLKASGKYLMYLDSDEEIENPDSLKTKLSAFQSNKKVKGVISSGYKSPKNFPSINRYINECGDPFSFFIYKETINYKFFLNFLILRYGKVHEDENFVLFDFTRVKPLPLLELVAMGCMIDLKYVRNNFPEIKQNPSLVTHYFYLLNNKNNLFAVTKNDVIIHYSSDTNKKYLNKISWRIKNNLFSKETIGAAGFEGRDNFQPSWFRLKRFLFIPYSFSFVLPVIDGLILIFKRKDWIFLLHPFLCIYTSFLILYYYFLKVLNFNPQQKRYGT